MATIPSAKSVRRSELESPESSRPSSPEADASHAAHAQAKLAAFFSQNFAETAAPNSTDVVTNQHGLDKAPEPAESQQENAEDGAYSFRLFGKPLGPSQSTEAVQPAKIVIRSPSPLNTEPGLVRTRSRDHYLARPWTSKEHAEASSVVRTPEQLLAEAKQQWNGCKLPWRVQVIRVTKKQAATLSDHTMVPVQSASAVEPSSRKRRPNRKRRIVLRKRAQAKVDKAAKRQKDSEEKEAAEREKRTRRNREKKVKRKQKEKAKKEVDTVGPVQDLASNEQA